MMGRNPQVLPENPAAQHGGSNGLSSSTVFEGNNIANDRQGMHSGEQQFGPSEFEQDKLLDEDKWPDSQIIDSPSDIVPNVTLEREAMIFPQYNQQGNEQFPFPEDFLAPNTHPQPPSINNNGNSWSFGMQSMEGNRSIRLLPNSYQPSDMVQNVIREREAMVSLQYNQQATGNEQLPLIKNILASDTHPQAPFINNNGKSGFFGMQSVEGNSSIRLPPNSYQPPGLNGEAMVRLPLWCCLPWQQQLAIPCDKNQQLSDLLLQKEFEVQNHLHTARNMTHSMGIEHISLNEDVSMPASDAHLQDSSVNIYGIRGSPSEEVLFTPPVNVQAMTDGAMDNLTIQVQRISQRLSEGHDVLSGHDHIIQVDEARTSTTPVNSLAKDGESDQMENLGTQGQQIYEGTDRRKNTPWTKREVNSLLEGVDEYGTSRWTGIRERYFAESTRTPRDLKDKFKNLTKMANNKNRILRGARLSEDVFNWVLRLNEKYGKASS